MGKIVLEGRRTWTAVKRWFSPDQDPRLKPSILVRPALAGGPFIFPPHMLFSAEAGSSAGNLYLTARRVAGKLKIVLDIGSDKFLSVPELRRRYESQYAEGIQEGNVDHLGETVLREALKILRSDLIIEEGEEGVRKFDQVRRINEVSLHLRAQLQGLDNLHDLVATAVRSCRKFPEFTDLYLYDPSSKEMIRAGSTSLVDYQSNYQSWQPLKEAGIFDLVINSELHRNKEGSIVGEVKGTGFRIAKFAKATGPIFLEDYLKYQQAFREPDEIRFQRGKDERNRTVIVTKRHTWVPKGAEDSNLRLYSGNCEGPKEVDAAWDLLDQTIASAIGRIIGDRSIREVWEEEGRQLKDLQKKEATPQVSPVPPVEVVPVTKVQAQTGEKIKVPRLGEEGYESWADRNEMAISRFYDKFTRIFAFICRLSRAYQLSVVEGIEHIIKDFKKRAEGKGEIRVVDAGVGSAYFLERLMQRAENEKLNIRATAIDLSKVACTIAKNVCKRFGDSVQVTKGNIARMTNYLENVDPLKPGSQDLVLLNYVLQYVPLEEVLMETNRVLRMEGRILITNFKPKESMRWNEFWTNVHASWACGKEKKFGHGRLYETARYFLLFFRHALGIVKFAADIDRDVREGIIPENPDKDKLVELLEKYGFEVMLIEDTHHHAALRFYARKTRNLEEHPAT